MKETHATTMKPPRKMPSLLAPIATGCLALASPALAAPEQVGDFRIAAGTYAGPFHYFDLGFTEATRGVVGAPVQLPSVFSGTTQNPGSVGDPLTDLGVRTFSTSTHLKTINRFTADPDGPGAASGPQRVGVFQYEIDLAPVETYLSGSGESLTGLDLRFVIDPSDDTKGYDIYLSYTEAGEGITLTPVSTDDATANYFDFWLASQGSFEGDVVNGTHKILNLDTSGDIDQTESLLGIYNAGVRKVNAIIVSGDFFSGRTLRVNENSGLWVNTDGLGTSTQVGDLLIDGFSGSFTHLDRLDGVTTRPVAGAPFDLPSVLTGTSQNQGDNIEAGPLAYYDIDGISGNAGSSTGGSGATVVGYGAAGIGPTAADGFQFTAFERSGSFDINVSLDSLASVETGARAGLMVRNGDGTGAAHVFVGFQQTGEPVVVVRDADGNTATETIGAVSPLPETLRIVRSGDDFTFYLSKNNSNPAPLASATVVMSDPVLVGFAATSGSDTNEATAVFSDCSVALADPATDIGLKTFSSVTTIRTLNRFGGQLAVGAVQWAIDLSPLDDYLASNNLNLDSLDLALIADASDTGREFDVYLSYDNPAESISLTGLAPQVARSTSLAELNYDNLFAPAIGAVADEIVGGTHKVLLPYTAGDINLTTDLLPLYSAGVRDLNLIVTTDAFYSARNLSVAAGSGLFLETSSGAPLQITDVVLDTINGELDLTIDGLAGGATYHLEDSTTLAGFTAIAGSDFVAAGTQDSVSTPVDTGVEAVRFVRVVQGPAP
ncbi:MAG: hypothetical protein HKN82_19715 [Akkermansiaceae bacterium]|nr:hypothetical protein [Akkermansiaceae bacterium]NNM29667.1 hypothetical protein [Akkermansiaceae bacterium]